MAEPSPAAHLDALQLIALVKRRRNQLQLQQTGDDAPAADDDDLWRASVQELAERSREKEDVAQLLAEHEVRLLPISR